MQQASPLNIPTDLHCFQLLLTPRLLHHFLLSLIPPVSTSSFVLPSLTPSNSRCSLIYTTISRPFVFSPHYHLLRYSRPWCRPQSFSFFSFLFLRFLLLRLTGPSLLPGPFRSFGFFNPAFLDAQRTLIYFSRLFHRLPVAAGSDLPSLKSLQQLEA